MKTTDTKKLEAYPETRKKRWGAGIILAIFSVLFLLSTGVAQGSKYPAMPPAVTTLYNFTGSGGLMPDGGLVADSAGNLFGTTYAGMVYELPCSGTPCTYPSMKVLSDNYINVGHSTGLTIDPRGNLYGVTFNGTVYELLRSGTPGTYQPEKVIYSNVGRGVVSPLVMDSEGNLYGTAVESGSTSCSYSGLVGSVFQTQGCGTVFELSPPEDGSPSAPYTLHVLHSFASSGPGGYAPLGGLLLGPLGDTLYGTTMMGGSDGYGTVFALSTSGTGFQILYSFSGSPGDGANPIAGLVMDSSGNLYGTTFGGGSFDSEGDFLNAYGTGTVFKLSPPARGKTAYTEQVLYSFDPTSIGAFPGSRLVMDSSGHLYGTVYFHGLQGVGGVFKINTTSGAMTVLGFFSPSSYFIESALRFLLSNFPVSFSGGVVMGPSGNLYGATFLGGSGPCSGIGCGTVFEVTNPDGEAGVLITQVNALLAAQVINQGQDGSLVGELQHAIQMIDAGKLHGAIGNLESFITEVDDLENSGVLTSEQAAPLVNLANAVIEQLQASL